MNNELRALVVPRLVKQRQCERERGASSASRVLRQFLPLQSA